MKRFLLLLALLSFGYSSLWGQKANLFNVRAGYLQSSTIVDVTNPLLIGLEPIKTSPGFYIGLAYEQPLSTLFTSQVEMNFQQKGHLHQSFSKEGSHRNTYNYIGITPTVGIQLIRKLTFSVGPEMNLLINESTAWSNSRIIELGVVGRGRYQFSRVGITGGYFRGLTVYDQSPTDTYAFTNHNWQVGLTYTLNKR